MLRQKVNPKTGKREWALVSASGKSLEYFGEEKPSEETFRKSESRVEMFKAMHKKGK